MTSYISADCPQCGPVQAALDRAHLVTQLADRRHGTLVYTCPACRQERQADLSRRATRLLLAAGITLVAAPTEDPAVRPPGSVTPASRSTLPQID